jgi:hypothetical protein
MFLIINISRLLPSQSHSRHDRSVTILEKIARIIRTHFTDHCSSLQTRTAPALVVPKLGTPIPLKSRRTSIQIHWLGRRLRLHLFKLFQFIPTTCRRLNFLPLLLPADRDMGMSIFSYLLRRAHRRSSFLFWAMSPCAKFI